MNLIQLILSWSCHLLNQYPFASANEPKSNVVVPELESLSSKVADFALPETHPIRWYVYNNVPLDEWPLPYIDIIKTGHVPKASIVDQNDEASFQANTLVRNKQHRQSDSFSDDTLISNPSEIKTNSGKPSDSCPQTMDDNMPSFVDEDHRSAIAN